jgi:hypothetical protein
MHTYINNETRRKRGDKKNLKQGSMETEGLLYPMQEHEAQKRCPPRGEKLQAAAEENGDELRH